MATKASIGVYVPGRYDLSPRLFTQSVNPLKHVALSGAVLDRAASDRQIFYDSVDSGRSASSVCIGYFWDSVKKQTITVKLGVVVCNLVGSRRSSASCADARHESFSRVEADVLRESFLSGAERPERSEDAPQADEKSPGPYVIPGQSPTDWTKQQKNGRTKSHGLDFEWSAEKCEAELC